MLTGTKAIVLHKSNYSESSLIVQVFTLEYGKIGLLIRGAKRRKSRTKSALFEPLSIIEIVANFSDTGKLVIPREVKLNTPFISIQSDISKRTIALFISEILHKCIKLPNPDYALFNYIEKALLSLEQSNRKNANFHLIFLLELSKHLGFQPQKSNGEFFDLVEGKFTNSIPQGTMYFRGEEKDLFLYLLGIKIEETAQINFTTNQRKIVLSSIIKYYQTHIPNLGEIKSHTVLETIFA